MRPTAFVRALRPQQWAKNLFVLAAPVFAYGDRLSGMSREAFRPTLLAFIGFCLASSAVYLLNDVLDIESDRRHPAKRLRPVASGELPVPAALFGALVLGAGALALGFALGGAPVSVGWILLGYMGLNL